jgi:hypothetical protein
MGCSHLQQSVRVAETPGSPKCKELPDPSTTPSRLFSARAVGAAEGRTLVQDDIGT